MRVEDLTIIGERINASVPGIGELLERGQWNEVARLAAEQVRAGARAVDINVGSLPDDVLIDAIGAVRGAVEVPLSVDSDDSARLLLGLELLTGNGTGPPPLLNSVTSARAPAILPRRREAVFGAVLLLSERSESGRVRLNETTAQMLQTASVLFEQARENGFEPAELYFDPGLPPVAGDAEGRLNVVLDVLEEIGGNPVLAGTHRLVGISNLTHHLPSAVRLPLQNAFLSLAADRGLDTIIGDPARAYRTLPEDDPVLTALRAILDAEGFERLSLLLELYR